MREYLQLDIIVKWQERLMLISTILWMLTLGVGLYFQLMGVNHDNMLLPLFGAFFGGFNFIYAVNALTIANLTPKWTPAWQYRSAQFITRKLSSFPEDKVNRLVNSFFGTGALIIAIASFVFPITTVVKHLF